jgi:hypothetical protein
MFCPLHIIKSHGKGGGKWKKPKRKCQNTNLGETHHPTKSLLPMYYGNQFLTQKIIIIILLKFGKTNLKSGELRLKFYPFL